MLKNIKRGFTLLELLIVISIIAILSVIVILVLNPSEMLKKARDSQRLADLNTIKTAIGLYTTGTTTPVLGIGSTSVGCGRSPATGRYVWYSKPGVSGTVDSNATATSSASASDVGRVDGTGWIPINLTVLNGGSPISNWPVDPINSIASLSAPVNTDLVYRYTCDTSTMQFQLGARLESNAFTSDDPKARNDGGNNVNLYEVGTALNIWGSGTQL